jgi:hypothetical protein
MSRKMCSWVVALAAALFVSTTLYSQVTTGTLLGRVADSTGAVLPGATVRATDVQTGAGRTASTNELGDYIFPGMPVGTYRIETTASGFKRGVRTDITLTVNQNARVDFQLEVGAMEQSVEVTGDATQVNTHNAELGNLVDEKRVADLPMNGRNVYDLVTLMPGVARVTTQAVYTRDNNTLSVLGGRPTTNNSMLDGGFNNDIWRNEMNSPPNPDAVQEMRVLAANTSAEFGRLPGATVNVITKSGTNDWHGTAYEFLRNNVLNARNFFASSVAPLRYNQYGGTFGGPVRRNKDFFFVSFEQLKQKVNTFSNSSRPPTAAERSGDFSAAAASQMPTDPDNGNTLFPGGKIPLTRVDPVAMNIISQTMPLPNTPDGRYEYYQAEKASQWQLLGKGDHHFNEKQKLSISYFYLHADLHDAFANGNNVPGYADRLNAVRQNNLVVNHTSILTPTLLNEARFNFMRRSTPWFWNYPPNSGNGNSAVEKTLNEFGSKMNVAAQPATPARITVSGRVTMGTYQALGLDQSLNWSDTLTWIRNRHTLKAGAWVMWGFYNESGTSAASGTITANGANSKNALSDFMLGRVSFTQDNGNFPDFRGKSVHMFFQDDWKVLPRLTLNLGMRYELSAPLVWTTDLMPVFIPGAKSTVFPTAPAGLLYKGDSGFIRGGRKFDKNNVAPRVGFSYDVFGNGRTAVRGAYGVFYLAQYGDGIRTTQPWIVSLTNPATASLVTPWSNFPGGDPFPVDPVKNPRYVLPITVIHFDPDAATPYVQQMNFTLEHQIDSKLTVQATYVATLGRKQQMNRDQNTPTFIPGASTATNYNSRRPYMPGTFAAIADYLTGGSSSYNGLQLVANRRFSRGFTILANYTFAKSLDIVSSDNLNASVSVTDSNNFRINRGPSDGQPIQIAKASFLWELPRVKTGTWVGRQILSGWQVNGIWSMQTGLPFTVTSGQDTNTDGNTNDRANIIGDPKLDTGRARSDLITKFFNTSAFAVPALGSPGNAARGILFGLPTSNTDLSFFKNFHFREKDELQFRAELFNAFNQVRLGNPTTAMNNANFGRILSAGAPRLVQFGLHYAF